MPKRQFAQTAEDKTTADDPSETKRLIFQKKKLRVLQRLEKLKKQINNDLTRFY